MGKRSTGARRSFAGLAAVPALLVDRLGQTQYKREKKFCGASSSPRLARAQAWADAVQARRSFAGLAAIPALLVDRLASYVLHSCGALQENGALGGSMHSYFIRRRQLEVSYTFKPEHLVKVDPSAYSLLVELRAAGRRIFDGLLPIRVEDGDLVAPLAIGQDTMPRRGEGAQTRRGHTRRHALVEQGDDFSLPRRRLSEVGACVAHAGNQCLLAVGATCWLCSPVVAYFAMLRSVAVWGWQSESKRWTMIQTSCIYFHQFSINSCLMARLKATKMLINRW